MKEVLGDITDGTFAARFIADQDAGAPEFAEFAQEERGAPDRGVGQRAARPDGWVKSHDDDYIEGTAAR